MITIYSANHRYKCLALALIVLGASSAFAISCLMSPGSSTVTTLESTPTPYPEQTWRINQSLTIGDFTVHLHQLRDTADGLRVVESYETTVSELNYLPIGSPGIQYANGTTDDAYGARLPSPGKDMSMSLGSFIVADTSLAGSVDIPLASVSESGELSPQPELLVGSRRYGVTKVVLWGDQLTISVQALNESAKRSTLGVAAAAPVEAILTDNTGRTYNRFPSGSMEFDPFNQELTEQSFRFHGVQGEDLSSATKLILTIRGGGNIVGPFVFDNIALVSEGIPPVTPTPPEPTPLPMTHTQQVNRTLTIGEVTVELEEIRRSSDALAARYSYQVSDPNLEVDQMINGFDLIRADGSIDGLQTASRTDDGSEIVNFDLSTRIPELGENVSISLGSYIVAGPEISGSVTIPLSSEYATALSKESETNGPVRIPLQAEMSIGDRRYKVAEMLVFPQKFRLWVYPANEAARSTELGVIDPAAVATLTANTGASYQYVGGDTAFDDLSPRGHKWRQFIFMGRVLPSVTSLTFSVKGGADIVGPFLFDNIALVSENIPPTTPTPPNVND